MEIGTWKMSSWARPVVCLFLFLFDSGNGKGCQRRAWDADPFQQPIPVYTVEHLHMLLITVADRLKVTVTSREIPDWEQSTVAQPWAQQHGRVPIASDLKQQTCPRGLERTLSHPHLTLELQAADTSVSSCICNVTQCHQCGKRR